MNKTPSLLVSLLLFATLSGCGSAPQRPVATVEGERLLARGVKAYRNDELVDAAHFFTKSLTHYQGLDHASGQLQSRINLTEVALAVGNLDAARRHLEQAELLASGELATYRTRLILLRSSLALADGDMKSAINLSESLLPQRLGGSATSPIDDTLVRESLVNRTTVAFANEGDDPAAWAGRLEKAAGSDANASARLERFRAALAVRGGDRPQAMRHLQHALDLCKEIPSRRCIAGTLEEWGATLQEAGDLAGAEDRYQRALAVRLALLDRGGSSKTLRRLADISQITGRSGRATLLGGWSESVATGATIDWNQIRSETLPR